MNNKDMNNSKVNYMICDLCHVKLHPLDAHMGRLKGKLVCSHIDCWNKAVEIEKGVHYELEPSKKESKANR